MNAPSKIRLGLVGCGLIARRHAEVLRADARADWRVLCDPNVDSARAFRDAYAPSAEIVADFAEALRCGPLDAVILCSPNSAHYAQTCAALGAGLHVLCEKPLALRRDEIDDVIARTARAGRIVSVAHQRRYKSLYVTARRELHERAESYGPIREVHLFLCEHWSQSIVGTWRDDPTQNYGYFGDAGIHLIDAIDFVAALRPRRLYAVSDRRSRRVEIVTRVLAEMTGGVGLSAHFVGDAGHLREDLHFHCERGDLLVRDEKLFRCQAGRCEPIVDLVPDAHPTTAFLDAVANGRPTVSTPEVAIPILAWNRAVMNSLQRREWVDVEN
jgi:predicted dehydrogenase